MFAPVTFPPSPVDVTHTQQLRGYTLSLSLTQPTPSDNYRLVVQLTPGVNVDAEDSSFSIANLVIVFPLSEIQAQAAAESLPGAPKTELQVVQERIDKFLVGVNALVPTPGGYTDAP